MLRSSKIFFVGEYRSIDVSEVWRRRFQRRNVLERERTERRSSFHRLGNDYHQSIKRDNHYNRKIRKRRRIHYNRHVRKRRRIQHNRQVRKRGQNQHRRRRTYHRRRRRSNSKLHNRKRRAQPAASIFRTDTVMLYNYQ